MSEELIKLSDIRKVEDEYKKEIKSKNRELHALKKDNKELRIMCERLNSRIAELTDRFNSDQIKIIEQLTEQQDLITKQQNLLFQRETE